MNRLHPGLSLGGRYTLHERIAVGGMGEVWESLDETLQRKVAVKVMRPSTEEEEVFARRFRAEAQHSAGLSHVNIATVFDYGEHEGLAFLVMELVTGKPLSLMITDQPLDHDLVRSIVGQAALALGAAHDGGVVHRDVKPANILVTEDGTVKLTDFGIARATDGSGHTRTGEVLGTPYYLSPEQALGKPATGASDLYSLGVVAHELLSGRRPFDAGTPVATALAHVTDPPPALPADVPSDIAAIVEQCLLKDPESRPATARLMAAALGMGLQVVPTATDEAASDVVGFAAAAEDEAQARTSPHTAPVARLAVPEPAPVAPEAHGGSDRTVMWSPNFTGPMSQPITRLTELDEILANLEPHRHEGTFANVSVQRPIEGVDAFMTVAEVEGLTMLVRQADADAHGLDYEVPLAWITLGAYRSISQLGIVPTVTTALFQAGVPAVAAAGHFHTHLFVPAESADKAMKVLARLSLAHREL